MQDPFDPDAMTPEQRERELSALLATGYLRHRALPACWAGQVGDHVGLGAINPDDAMTGCAQHLTHGRADPGCRTADSCNWHRVFLVKCRPLAA